MPLLSYQGAGALQGNRGLFPYYHRVPRLCMSVAAACGRLAKELGMHRFAMLYAKNDDGHAAFEAVKQVG